MSAPENASELMSTAAKSCGTNDTLQRAAQIMWDNDCGVVPVVDGDGHVVDMITDRDICMAAYAQGKPLQQIPVRTLWRSRITASGENLLPEAVQVYLTKPLSVVELQARAGNLRAAKIARDAIRASEARFRALFEQASDGIFIIDLDKGLCTDANGPGCQLLGYDREEILATPIVEFIAEEDVSRFSRIKDALLRGDMDRADAVLKRKDGAWLPVEVSAKILPDGRCQAFVRDIAERRRTEEALRLSEAKFSSIFSISCDAIISIDEAQRITMFNEGAESVFGYSRAEIVGLPLETMVPERFRSSHRQHVKRFAEGQETARRMGTRILPIFGLRKNGEEFPADAAISKLEVGGKTLLIVSLRDISEQKRIEDEQRLLAKTGKILVTAGSDYQRLLTDIANVLVPDIADWCIIDIVQGGDVRRLRVVHSDPARAATCDALERYPLDRRRPYLMSEVLETQRPMLMNDVTPEYLESISQSAEYLCMLRELDLRSFVAAPLIARGQSLGTFAFGSSRASRRYSPLGLGEAEQLAICVAMAVDNARLHEDLTRAVLARDEVLGIVAHDLRNPLNTIVLHTQLLRRGKEAERRDQKPIERILRAASRMNGLIQDLLDVTRLEAGERLAITQRAVPTAGVVAEAIEQQKEAISASDRQLNVDVAGELPGVWADRARLIQVFDNLLSNAIKFARGRITVGAVLKDGEVLFWVADDGEGVPAEDLPRLFDRFWQATRADRRGAGLGLSIVKGIVDAHGGRIWVESEAGVGATFYFTLPAAPPVEARPPPPELAA
jgi:PAS domain S-box-containing protein